MTREQMVEKAAEAAWRADAADGSVSTEGYVLDDAVGADRYRLQAKAAVNAILPQVSTVAELEALPMNSIITDSDDQPWQRFLSGWGSRGYVGESSAEWILRNFGPNLTVVWQPEEAK